MVLTRSPLRISLGGGGTDLPSYYRAHGGFLISAAIDKYVFVSVIRPFTPGIYLKYSRLEHVDRVDQVQHPIIRECLGMTERGIPQVEITTLADIPAGTGLGSSGSFTTALLKALYTYDRAFLHPADLARLACEVEIDRLKEPIGKQDQYIAAFGGITCFTFSQDDSVEAAPLAISPKTLLDLEDNLLLFFTGVHRSASAVLKDQDVRTRESDAQMIANLHTVKDLAVRSKRAMEEGRCAEFGEIMHEHWLNKKKRSEGMSTSTIDEWYDLGRANGAIGGKVVGAGGGGFLLFYAEDRGRLRRAMARAGLEEVRFRFDFEGTKVLLS
ncbi:MAG TPA: galactokinase [Spirochaetia bacterium]|nr:galactokinase [Spirochaetia bacterium]